MKKIKIIIFLFLFLITTKANAEDLELKYNLRPMTDNYSVIDGSVHNELDFFYMKMKWYFIMVLKLI